MSITLISPTNVLVELNDKTYRQVDINTVPVAFLPVLLKTINDHFDETSMYGGGLDFQLKQLRSLSDIGFDDQREQDNLLREYLLIVCETWFKMGRNTLLPKNMQSKKTRPQHAPASSKSEAQAKQAQSKETVTCDSFKQSNR